MKLGPVYPTPKPTCTYDGAYWMEPPKWCECGPPFTPPGPYSYPTLSASANATTVNCNYSVLPASTIKPFTITPAPTNIPGENGLSPCVFVSYPNEEACTYANYCNCNGIAQPFLTTLSSGQLVTGCNYTIQPTTSNCPPPTFTPSSSTPTPTSSTPTATLKCNPTDSPAAYALFSRDKAITRITNTCTFLGSKKLVLNKLSTKDAIKDVTANAATSNDPNINVLSAWSDSNCNAPDVDFGAISIEQCVGYFLPAMDSCPDFVQPAGNDVPWKIGGTYTQNCTSWSINGSPA